MKPNHKFLRVVLGAVVGAALWAGCATERQDVNEPAGASNVDQRQPRLDRQADLTDWRADTHPEWRTGWNMAFPHSPHGTPDADDVHTAVDQPSLAPPETR